MSPDSRVASAPRSFIVLAHGLYAVGHAVNCDELCGHAHDGHGCELEGHACGCPHSESYDFDWEPSDDVAERWSERALASLLQFISRLDCHALSVGEIEARLEWWWLGENRALRKTMENVHRTRCERGRGVLVNRVTGEVLAARCKSWRDCAYCAWVYGREVERLFKQVRRLRAFVVFTMPADAGDWSNKEHIAAQAKAMRRLSERLFRCFDRRFSMVWTREHNTKLDGSGRIHLNVLWDEDWVDQAWLSKTAAACGFGEVVDISRVGAGGRHALRSGRRRGQRAERYATKCLRYASKDLSSQTDWPKSTRRWGASRAARTQMKRPERNPDWFFALQEPPTDFLPCDFSRFKTERSPECVCLDICLCGAPTRRVPLTFRERIERARASPDPPS